MVGETRVGSFEISQRESEDFAAVSGDSNPIHVDPLAARRLLYGETVTHGVHGTLLALDRICEGAAVDRLASLAVAFTGPVRAGESVDVVRLDGGAEATAYELRRGGVRVQTLKLSLDAEASHSEFPLPEDRLVEPSAPRECSIEGAASVAGRIPLVAERDGVARLFPSLSSRLPPARIAALLACTRIVGMECPGLHSLFTRLRLEFGDSGSPSREAVEFSVDRVEERFAMVRIGVRGPGFHGELEALFRPPAVRQATFADVCDGVRPNEFAGRHALVVGGSRGLGEVTAKLLAAGGARVTVGYARGRADAEAVVGEILDGGGDARAVQWDVARIDALRGEALGGFDHLYYFASPRIELHRGSAVAARLERYRSIFVHGFAETVEACVRGDEMGHSGSLRVFYPSTVFLDGEGPSAVEYTTAKAEGEALCRELDLRPELAIDCPRLPRMRTDQTATLFGTGDAVDPVPVLLDALRAQREPQ